MVNPYSSDDLLTACVAFTGPQEGCIPYLYLDTAEPPNVTVAYGRMLPNAAAGVTVFGFTSQDDIDSFDAQFAAVTAAPGGKMPGFYEKLTSVRLTQDQCTELFRQDLSKHVTACANHVADFWTIPGPVQVACVDIDYNVGDVRKFPHFLLCIGQGDWEGAAVQSNRPQLPGRSQATAALIRSVIEADPAVVS